MAAPTFVADYGVSSWQSTTTTKTQSVTVSNGDVLCAVAATTDSSTTVSNPSGGGLSWSLQKSDVQAGFCAIYGWTATPSSNQTFTFSDSSSGTHLSWGDDVLRFSGSLGAGASAKASSASGTPSVSITTTQANSAVVVIIADWLAVDGASRTWLTVNSITPTAANGLERVYSRQSGFYAAYVAYYSDVGAAGAKTVGLSAPGSQKYEIIAIEITGSTTGKNIAAAPSFALATSATLTKVAGPLKPLSTPNGEPPKITVQAGFGAIGPGQFSWTDITPYVRSLNVNRSVTRLAGPLYQWQAGTASLVLKNGDGRFDPDNLAGPYVSTTGLQPVTTVLTSGTSWPAPSNLDATGPTPTVEMWAGGGGGGADNGSTAGGHHSGAGGGGGEYVKYSYPLTPGTSYSFAIGAAGTAGASSSDSPGGDGGDTTFDAAAIKANGGKGGAAAGGAGGAGGTGSHSGAVILATAGGAGGNGISPSSTNTGGGGGGGSGSPFGSGNPGAVWQSGVGAPGGAAQVDGGPGGRGGYATKAPFNGQKPIAGPGGGGGGAGADGTPNSGGGGYKGQIRITYYITVTLGLYSQILPMLPLSIQATWSVPVTAFLAGDNTGFEVTTGSWTGTGNSNISRTTSQAHTGAASLQLSSAASGDQSASNASTALAMSNGMFCSQNDPVTASCWFRTAVSARSCEIGIEFFDSSATSLGVTFGDTITDSTSAWKQATVLVTTPVTAIACRVITRVLATGGAAEIHYVDDVLLSDSGVTYNLFYGYVTSWKDAGLNNPRYAEVQVDASDGMYVLQGVNLAALGSPIGDGDDTGDRIARILAAAGWNAGQEALDSGDTTLQGTTYGDTALGLIQVATDTEVGEFYIDGSGNAVFRRRSALFSDDRSTTVNCVLGDRPGSGQANGLELPYFQVVEQMDDTTIFNDIQATRVGGVLQEAIDPASVSRYLFPRTYERSDLLHQSDGDALGWAQYILSIAVIVEDRFDQITLHPQRAPSELFPHALGREIGDLIEVWRRPPSVGGFGTECFVRSISHQWDAGTNLWETVWGTQNAERFDFLILDDSSQGLLDIDSLGF